MKKKQILFSFEFGAFFFLFLFISLFICVNSKTTINNNVVSSRLSAIGRVALHTLPACRILWNAHSVCLRIRLVARCESKFKQMSERPRRRLNNTMWERLMAKQNNNGQHRRSVGRSTIWSVGRSVDCEKAQQCAETSTQFTIRRNQHYTYIVTRHRSMWQDREIESILMNNRKYLKFK